MGKKNYDEMSKQILELVGGKENIGYFTHCVTRLRFNVRDKYLVNTDELGKIKGVIGTQWSGEQLQVIVGQDVEKIYSIISKDAGLAEEAAIDENLDTALKKSKKFSVKQVGEKSIAYLFSSVSNVIPLLMVAGLAKTVASILGPVGFNVITDTSDLYLVLGFLFDASFYFLPIYLGYSAAKALHTDVALGIYMGALILVPNFVAMVGVRETLNVFGINVPVASYGQSFLPVILGVWIMSYVNKFLKKVIPNILSAIFVPFLTVVIMTPLMFAVCGPFGSLIGGSISSFFMYMGGSNDIIRIIGSMLLGASYPYLTLFGLHATAYIAAYTTYFELGYESFLMPMGYMFSWLTFGMALGAFIKYKKQENKGAAIGYFTSGIIGGITEPTLYGICLKNKKAMIVMVLCCAIGGLITGIIHVRVYVAGMPNLINIALIWTGGSITNIIKGVGLEIISLMLGLVGTLLFVDFEEVSVKK